MYMYVIEFSSAIQNATSKILYCLELVQIRLSSVNHKSSINHLLHLEKVRQTTVPLLFMKIFDFFKIGGVCLSIIVFSVFL